MRNRAVHAERVKQALAHLFARALHESKPVKGKLFPVTQPEGVRVVRPVGFKVHNDDAALLLERTVHRALKDHAFSVFWQNKARVCGRGGNFHGKPVLALHTRRSKNPLRGFAAEKTFHMPKVDRLRLIGRKVAFPDQTAELPGGVFQCLAEFGELHESVQGRAALRRSQARFFEERRARGGREALRKPARRKVGGRDLRAHAAQGGVRVAVRKLRLKLSA